jgi:hypothetical protein
MAISEAMMAQALFDYFQQHEKCFEEFILERCNIDDGFVSWGGDNTNKRLLLIVTKRAQDGGILAESDYAINITRVDRAPRSQ